MRLLLKIKFISARTNEQLRSLRNIWDNINEELQMCFYLSVQMLRMELDKGLGLINGLDKGSKNEDSKQHIAGKMRSIKKLDYAVHLKGCLSKIVVSLTDWQGFVDPSWYYLILRNTSTYSDRQLEEHEAKLAHLGDGAEDETSNPFSLMQALRRAIDSDKVYVTGTPYKAMSMDDLSPSRRPIPHSATEVSQLIVGSVTGTQVLVDKVMCNEKADVARTRKDTRNLAKILSKVDPLVFGLLKCHGVTERESVIADKRSCEFELVFAIPPGLGDPLSLRTLLLNKSRSYPLNERFDLARGFAKSVLFVHTSQFVHKNIRPDNIIVMKKEASEGNAEMRMISAPFLVGFDKFRLAEGGTYYVSDGVWQYDLYRHPKRQGPQPEDGSMMQHDIYSLGVCLLEIGLWTSFVHYPEGSDAPLPLPELKEATITGKERRHVAITLKDTLTSKIPFRGALALGSAYSTIQLWRVKSYQP